MKFLQPKAFFLFATSLFLLTACGRSENTNQNANKAANLSNTNTSLTKDDVEDFGKIVNLPFQPEEVSWRESADKKITAVMRFSAADANSLTAQIEKQKTPQTAAINADDWFPPELVAQSQQSGDASLKGKEYSANDFFLAPYNKGKITRIDDTNYFILELSAS